MTSALSGNWRDENSAIFDATVRAAANQLGVQALAVEKDYWVCRALKALAEEYPDNIVFKGGTSLEKRRIIQRFSEDLDLLVVGIEGNNPAKKALKAMVEVAASATGKTATPDRSGGNPGSFHRSAYLNPPLQHQPTGGVADTNAVLIELGQSGGDNPSAKHTVESLFARAFKEGSSDVNIHEWDDLTPFEVTILHPGRTLIEKMLRINNFVVRTPDPSDPHGLPRIGRQFYDIHELLGHTEVQEFLADKTAASDVLTEVIEVSQAFKGDEPMPTGGFAASAAFDPHGQYAADLRREHNTAITHLHYGPTGTAPSFDEVLARVKEHTNLLRLDPQPLQREQPLGE